MMYGLMRDRRPHHARQVDARGGLGPRGGRDARHQRRPVDRLTFFIGSAMAGVAGVMSGLAFNQISATIGFLAGLKAFTAAVVGGIGSIPGAMIGGLVHRAVRGVRLQLHLHQVLRPDRVRDPDRDDARAPDGHLRPAGAAEGLTGRAMPIGVDEWVAQHRTRPRRRAPAGDRWLYARRGACGLVAAAGASCRAAGLLFALLRLNSNISAGRHQLPALRDPRRRPQHRRRLGRPARPRLHRVLRLRRLRLRLLLLHGAGHRWLGRRPPVRPGVDPDRDGRRRSAGRGHRPGRRCGCRATTWRS